jgi:dihydroneopterin aldolase
MPIADAGRAIRHLFIRDLVLSCRIGVYDHEQRTPQRVRINVDLGVSEAGASDRLDDVVDYEALLGRIKTVAGTGHVNLIETLAENLAALCLEDQRVRLARIRVEKLDVFPEAAAVGVEIERRRAGR